MAVEQLSRAKVSFMHAELAAHASFQGAGLAMSAIIAAHFGASFSNAGISACAAAVEKLPLIFSLQAGQHGLGSYLVAETFAALASLHRLCSVSPHFVGDSALSLSLSSLPYAFSATHCALRRT